MNKQIFDKIQAHEMLLDDELLSIKSLIDQKIIIGQNGNFRLNSIYKIGFIELQKHFANLKTKYDIENLTMDFYDLNGAKDGDFVIVRRNMNPRAKSKAKVIVIIENSSKPSLIYFKNGKFFLVSHPEVEVEFELKSAKNFDIFVADLFEKKVLKIVGNVSDALTDEFVSLFLYAQDYRLDGFSDFNLEEKSGERVDLRHLPFCTIDPATAKDHDDAIYYDELNNTLFVAIADVSYFVKEGTKLDEQAKKRAVSVYLPHKVLPMLPPILSEQECSLRPNEEKFAFVFEIVFEKNGLDVQYSKLYEAKIISKAKFSYEYIDSLIRGELDDQKDDILQSLEKFYRISARMRKERLKKGFDFESEELRLELDENMQLSNVVVERSSPSHSLVEEAMLLANTEAAKILKSKGIFRNHAEPSSKSIDKVANQLLSLGIKTKNTHDIHKFIESVQQAAKGLVYEKEINDLLIRSQQLAVYGSLNIGHFGLGFKAYSHFTSPIRRYADLVLHRILKSKKIPKNIDEICEHINQVSRSADELVWDFEDRKLARWADQNKNIKIEAMIIDTQRGVARSLTPFEGLKIVVEDHDFEPLFERIFVRISEVDLISKKITAKKVI